MSAISPKISKCIDEWCRRHAIPSMVWGLDGQKTGLISLLLAEIRLYTAPSHTEAWLYKAVRWLPGHKARLLTRFRRNQPEN